MDLAKYLGLQYDITNRTGVNCWSLVGLVLHDELGVRVRLYRAENNSVEGIANEFEFRIQEGRHGFEPVTGERKDLDVAIFTSKLDSKKSYHCGIMWRGKVLHAKGRARTGSVWHDRLKDIEYQTVRFYRYAGHKKHDGADT